MKTTLYNNPSLKPLRRQLRHNQTPAEKIVWNIVRNRNTQNLKFFRQYSVGKYILDFYCPEILLAIELDGGQHNTPTGISNDNERSRYLANIGVHVLRFWNNDVLENNDGVHQKLVNTINSLRPQ